MQQHSFFLRQWIHNTETLEIKRRKEGSSYTKIAIMMVTSDLHIFLFVDEIAGSDFPVTQCGFITKETVKSESGDRNSYFIRTLASIGYSLERPKNS